MNIIPPIVFLYTVIGMFFFIIVYKTFEHDVLDEKTFWTKLPKWAKVAFRVFAFIFWPIILAVLFVTVVFFGMVIMVYEDIIE